VGATFTIIELCGSLATHYRCQAFSSQEGITLGN